MYKISFQMYATYCSKKKTCVLTSTVLLDWANTTKRIAFSFYYIYISWGSLIQFCTIYHSIFEWQKKIKRSNNVNFHWALNIIRFRSVFINRLQSRAQINQHIQIVWHKMRKLTWTRKNWEKKIVKTRINAWEIIILAVIIPAVLFSFVF